MGSGREGLAVCGLDPISKLFSWHHLICHS